MTLYQGRIPNTHGELMQAINRSLPVDLRLLPFDVAVNRAWTSELARLGVFTAAEAQAVGAALDDILTMAARGDFDPAPPDEDVHTLIERLLTERLGETGARIHTGRSRNDQVACDLRLFLMDALASLRGDLHALIGLLADLGAQQAATPMAGQTHLQPAQPITLGYFLVSLAFALARDAERIEDSLARIGQCPLGSGALAGSGFPVDRASLAAALGFRCVTDNALDAVSDRDVAQETVAHCAILATHLSRYAEQFVLWASPAFGYLRFSDEWSTGSSMMPQKRNPDAMELVRAKAARVIGQNMTLLALTKGLPLAYAKDLQEDKPALFDALDSTRLMVQVFHHALASATFDAQRLRRDLTPDLLATDLADRLTERGAPFRQAHARVGRFVSALESRTDAGFSFDDADVAAAFPELDDDSRRLSVEAALERRSIRGGTAPSEVLRQVAVITAWLEERRREAGGA